MPKSKKKRDEDDMPRRFKQAMEIQKLYELKKSGKSLKGRQAGRSRRTSSKPAKQVKPAVTQQSNAFSEPLKIKAGESMSDFNRRVDASIPLPKARGDDCRKTMKNQKKHKAKAENLRAEYAQKLDAKRRRQEEEDEDNLEVPDDGEDIWVSVNAKARKPKFGEVADRPPELPRLKQFSSVPKAAGSMARRQILEEERMKVIEHYRKLKDNFSSAAEVERANQD